MLFRLYSTLGKRTGAERPEPRPQPAQGELPREDVSPAPKPASTARRPRRGRPDGDRPRRPQLRHRAFRLGARGAYELIVGAFAKGDRDALRRLLTPRVFESYVTAIAAREAKGEAGPELVRLKSGEIVDADLSGDNARVTVKFEAELAEGAHGVRDAREKWTFERDVRSPDPNWRLARVTAA